MPSSITSSDGASAPLSDVGEAEDEDHQYIDEESMSDTEHDADHPNIIWTGYQKRTPSLIFYSEVVVKKRSDLRTTGEKYHLAYKIVRTECRLVRSILSGHGFHEAHPNSSDFNMMWTGTHLKPYVLRSLTEYQKVNHFPRSYELTRKDRLYKNIQKMQQTKGFKHFDFIPTSYVLPGEFQEFCAAFLKDKGPWIVKPIASSRGRGIFLVSHPDQIPLDEQLIVSKYVPNPLLVDGFKFDVRLYVAVTSYDPLIIYLYEEGLTRFATVKYDKGAKNLRNHCMHLTNYSVNKKNHDYVHNDDAEVEDYGNKWSLGALLRYLRSEDKDTTALMMRIEDVLIKSILSVEPQVATACKMFMPFRGNCFELYGFDILIDEALRPWILEVNLSPSLACDSPLDLKIKANMMSDLFTLVGFVCHDPMVRKVYQSKRNVDVASKTAARTLRNRATSAKANNLRTDLDKPKRSRPQSASSLSGSVRGTGQRNTGVSGLSGEEIRIVRKAKEEVKRRGGWVRIFPSYESWDLYGAFMQNSSNHNLMLHQRLYPEKKLKRAMRVKLPGADNKAYQIHTAAHPQMIIGKSTFSVSGRRRSVQYEGRLTAFGQTKKKRKMKRPATSSVVVNPQSVFRGTLVQGVVSKTDVSESKIKQINGASNQQEISSKEDANEITSQVASSTIDDQSTDAVLDDATDAAVKEENPPTPSPPPPPKYNVVQILQSGGCMSKVQARTAFATYLSRVQQRLIAEHGSNDQSNCDAQNEQMAKLTRDIDLVLRFLKRAAGNLQQSFKVVVPSRRLPINDRRRILAKQLGDFVHIYSRETEQLRQRQNLDWRRLHRSEVDKSSLDDKRFAEFLSFASECELEEVLTTYTKIHKSASIFLGGGHNGKGMTTTETQHRPVSAIASKSDTSLLKRRESRENLVADHSEPVNPVDKYTCKANHSTNETRNKAETKLANGQQQNIAPVSSYASAVALYSAKYAPRQRPMSATHGTTGRTGISSRPSSATLTRPMSASSLRERTDPHLSGGQGDGYTDDETVNDALQRLSLKQQTRQYSASKGASILSNSVMNNSDKPNQTINAHNESITGPSDEQMDQVAGNMIKMQLTQLSQRLARHNALQHARSAGRNLPSNGDLTQYDSDLTCSYGKQSGGTSTTNRSGTQFAVAQQVKHQREQSKALLEQSKAKHQAMVAQAHAAHHTRGCANSDVPANTEIAIQHYTPKPPPGPAVHRKPISNSRISRTTSGDDAFSAPVYNSYKYDSNHIVRSPYSTRVTDW
ncbi:tubulin polyglutamylase TTLL5-like isoform X2 [Tubulanus polymorphus]|uniref:tubulin polyglutamylase TTLL5-like isoform X2 n=1 Tax=Tubulanus polymorphus TaxID=672921 RepID=UPI003DA245B5